MRERKRYFIMYQNHLNGIWEFDYGKTFITRWGVDRYIKKYVFNGRHVSPLRLVYGLPSEYYSKRNDNFKFIYHLEKMNRIQWLFKEKGQAETQSIMAEERRAKELKEKEKQSARRKLKKASFRLKLNNNAAKTQKKRQKQLNKKLKKSFSGVLTCNGKISIKIENDMTSILIGNKVIIDLLQDDGSVKVETSTGEQNTFKNDNIKAIINTVYNILEANV